MNMKSLARASDITKLDEKAQHVAMIPSLCLMESAGLQAYQIWKPRLSKTDRLVFLCGPGNNGGDALVVSRYAFGDGFTNQLLIYTGSEFLIPVHDIEHRPSVWDYLPGGRGN
jgi:NAD(P)H-hydrate epimerase